MDLSTIPDWFDVMHGAYARNLNRIMEGRRFHDEGDETAGYDFRVARVASVTVGIDSAGIFAGITVVDTEGREWTFYSHGTVADADDATVGTHSLALGPDPSPIVGRTPPVPLVDVAAALAREQWENDREPSDHEIYNRHGVEGGIAYDTFSEPGSLGEHDWRL